MGNKDEMMRCGRGNPAYGCNRQPRRRGWGTMNRTACGCESGDGQPREDYHDHDSYDHSGGDGLGGICRLFGGCNDRRDDNPRPQCDREESWNRPGECCCGQNDSHIQPRRWEPSAQSYRNCHALMRQLQELDFSIQETVLYLDAYPECKQALAYYHDLVERRKALAAQYEADCGPLCAMGNESKDRWDWTSAPWPWHPDFPGNGKK